MEFLGFFLNFHQDLRRVEVGPAPVNGSDVKGGIRGCLFHDSFQNITVRLSHWCAITRGIRVAVTENRIAGFGFEMVSSAISTKILDSRIGVKKEFKEQKSKNKTKGHLQDFCYAPIGSSGFTCHINGR